MSWKVSKPSEFSTDAMNTTVYCLLFSSSSCSDSPDYLVVRDGMDSNAGVIALYCNTLNGEQVLSSGENLYIEFVVDERKQRQGFAADFKFIKEDQLSPGKSSPQPTSFPHSPGGYNNNTLFLIVIFEGSYFRMVIYFCGILWEFLNKFLW